MLFGYYFERNFNRHFLVEVDFRGVFAEFLNGFLEHDDFAVDVVAEFFKCFSNLDVVYRTEDGAGCRCFRTDSQGNIGKRSCNGLCVGLDFRELVGALALVFLKLFEV